MALRRIRKRYRKSYIPSRKEKVPLENSLTPIPEGKSSKGFDITKIDVNQEKIKLDVCSLFDMYCVDLGYFGTITDNVWTISIVKNTTRQNK